MDKKARNITIILSGLAIAAGLIYWQKRKVIRFAKSLIGQTEISGNMGFNDPAFQRMMEGIGWNPGDQWCVYFSKVVWINKFPEIKDKLMKLISGNSQITYNNFAKDTTGLFEVSLIPKAGDIVIWQYYNSSGIAEQRGHAGVVKKAKADGTFETIEGNTTSTTVTNEGYIVAEKTHNLKLELQRKTGLRPRGFIHYKYA